MNKPPFQNAGAVTIIAIRHGLPENGKFHAVLSDGGLDSAHQLATLVKKHLTRDGKGVLICHSHSIRAMHTAVEMARCFDKDTLAIGHMELGSDGYCDGEDNMKRVQAILSHFPEVKVVIFVGHHNSAPGLICAFSESIGGPGLEYFEPGFCDGAMIDLESGEIIKHPLAYLVHLESVSQG